MYLNSVNLRIARDNVRAHIPAALDLVQGDHPDELPNPHTKPVFARDPVSAVG